VGVMMYGEYKYKPYKAQSSVSWNISDGESSQ